MERTRPPVQDGKYDDSKQITWSNNLSLPYVECDF
jgi:hypothetical protein